MSQDIEARTSPALRPAASLSLIVWVVGCVNTSSFQTAEVVGRGDSTGGVGLTVVGHGDYEFDDGETGKTTTFPLVSGWYRRGISDQLELQGMFSLMSGIEAGGKYRVLGITGEQGHHLAVGTSARLGGMRVSSTNEEAPALSAEWASVFDTVVPIYFGYRFSSSTAAYLTPQYVFRSVLRDESQHTHVVGSNLGLEWGSVLFDVMGAYDVQAEAPLFSVGVGKSL